MNEVIFKLALQAMDFHGAIDIDSELKMTNSELQEFAELIIRKCANFVDTGISDGGVDGRSLKEHFGIKE